MKTKASILIAFIFMMVTVYSNENADQKKVSILSFYISGFGELVDQSPDKKLLKKYAIPEIMEGYTVASFNEMVEEIEDEIIFNLILELEEKGISIKQVVLSPDIECVKDENCLQLEAYTKNDTTLVISRKKINNPDQTFRRTNQNTMNAQENKPLTHYSNQSYNPQNDEFLLYF